MSVLKIIDPNDVNVTPFKSYKEFTVTNVDSGSGIYGIRGIWSNSYNFTKANSGNITFESASFHFLPTWHLINQKFYGQTDPGIKRADNDFTRIYLNPKYPKQYKILHKSSSMISVSQKMYGERIKPKSIRLTDDSTSSTVTIVDDGNGNLYDNSLSSSFAEFAANNFNDSDVIKSTGSFAGNIFYEHGLLVFTNTGSKFVDTGTGKGTDGFSLKYQSQITTYEHSYNCIVGEGEFNGTSNVSATFQRSGSSTVIGANTGSYSWEKFLPAGDAQFKSGSFNDTIIQAKNYEGFVSHSKFSPYITKVGLYNDDNELLAVGQLARPIKNDDELSLSINVRFDA
jgi:hypothetical protein